MLHPVPPPEPPPILEPVQPASSTLSTSEIQFHPVFETDVKTLEKSEKFETPRERLPLQKTGQNRLTSGELLVAQTATAPPQPETFPPEFSPISAAKSAATLGQNISVGYPVEQVQVSQSSTLR